MENNRKYKIYGLKSFYEDKLRYIGLTKRSLTKRLSSHITESKRRNTHKDSWIKKNNFNITIILIEDNIKNLEEANEREIFWIKYYKDLGYNLVNSSEGGNGTVGVKMSEEHKKKLSLLYKGKPLSEEHRKKISISRKGKKFTEEQKIRHKISKQNISDETKFKFKIAKYKTWLHKNGYDVTNLNDLEIFELRTSIKLFERNEIEKIKTIKNNEINEKKLKKEETKINKKNELLKKKQEKLELKNIERERKIKEGLIRVIEKKDGKKIYVPVITEEQKKKNALYNKTHKQSEESIEKRKLKMKQYWKENPRLLTQEQKDHLSEINKGKKQSKETILKRSLKTRGEGNGCAKINENEVLEIRYAIKNNTHTRKELAKKYNLDYTTVCKIVNKQLWSHIS